MADMTFPLVIMVLGFSAGTLIAAQSIVNTVKRLERLVDLLVKQAGIDVREVASREARALVRENKKIQAIKAYREYTGVALAEAKAAIEKMQGDAPPA